MIICGCMAGKRYRTETDSWYFCEYCPAGEFLARKHIESHLDLCERNNYSDTTVTNGDTPMIHQIVGRLETVLKAIEASQPIAASMLSNMIELIKDKLQTKHTETTTCEHSGVEFSATKAKEYSQGFDEAVTLCKNVISHTVHGTEQQIAIDEIDRRIKT